MASFVSNQIADRAYTVTKSDTAANIYSYLYVGGAGDVAVVTEGGDSVTFVGVQAGQYLWVRTSKVMSTNTTATSILGFV
jgi:hypothetical protein